MDSLHIKTWHYQLLAGITNTFLVIFLFFCTVNSLTSLPIDKALICLCPVLISITNPDKSLFTSKEFIVFIVFTVLAVLSSVANLIFFPMIFFPIAGFCFSVTISKNKSLLLFSLYYALLIHIILGIIIVILAFLGISDLYVSTGAKGFAFLYATHGFTATVQTYGTLCITWLMLYMLRKKLGLNTKIDRLFFLITSIAILLTFNRSTYLFWVLILFFEFPGFFLSIIIAMIIGVIKFWNILVAFIFSSASLTARSQLLEGFKISYLHSNSFMVYLFGRGTDQVPESIIKTVKWTTRSDLENGYAMLLHTYGIFGLTIYIVISFYFIIMFLKINRYKEASFLFFYFFITQYITQEFVSTTFYLLLGVMMLMYDYYRNPGTFINQPS